MSSHQPVDTVKNRPLGTQAAPVCEGGVFARDRLVTADCSRGLQPARGSPGAGTGYLSVAVPGTFRQRSMARKLKSDKLLFTAMLLLVCTSIVMVYSASAVIMTERQSPYLLLFKQAAWVLIGLSLVPIVMRIDYRCYRQPLVIWAGLGIAVAGAVAVLFSAPVNGASRWLHVGPLGVQPSELAKIVDHHVHGRAPRAPDGSASTSLRYSLLPIGIVTGAIVGLILVEPDLGTAVSVLVIAIAMVFAAGISYRYVVGLALLVVPALYLVVMSLAVPRAANNGVPRSVGRSAGRRLSGHPVDDRRRHRRRSSVAD